MKFENFVLTAASDMHSGAVTACNVMSTYYYGADYVVKLGTDTSKCLLDVSIYDNGYGDRLRVNYTSQTSFYC